MRHSITIQIDLDALRSYTDEHIAHLWSVAQANPAPMGDKAADEIVTAISYEIIQRWLEDHPPSLYGHQPGEYEWAKNHLDRDTREAA